MPWIDRKIKIPTRIPPTAVEKSYWSSFLPEAPPTKPNYVDVFPPASLGSLVSWEDQNLSISPSPKYNCRHSRKRSLSRRGIPLTLLSLVLPLFNDHKVEHVGALLNGEASALTSSSTARRQVRGKNLILLLHHQERAHSLRQSHPRRLPRQSLSTTGGIWARLICRHFCFWLLFPAPRNVKTQN